MAEKTEIYILAEEDEWRKLNGEVEKSYVYISESEERDLQTFETAEGTEWIKYDSFQERPLEHDRGADINYSEELPEYAIKSLEHFADIHGSKLEALEQL